MQQQSNNNSVSVCVYIYSDSGDNLLKILKNLYALDSHESFLKKASEPLCSGGSHAVRLCMVGVQQVSFSISLLSLIQLRPVS